MKVILDEELFTGHILAQSSLHLLSIFQLGFERRHTIVLSFKRAHSAPFEAWIENRPAYEKEAIEGALRNGRQSDTRDIFDNVIRVTPSQEPHWRNQPPCIPPSLAAELLVKPLELIVEDEMSDQNFLRAVAVGPQADEFFRFIERKWIKFTNGGGVTNMLRKVEHHQDHPDFRRRTWLIFDSDALAPDLPPHKNSQELSDLCATSLVPYHCLWRRAMENYLPPEFLMERLRGKPQEHVADAFQQLTMPEQRHHYNMKTGFDGDKARLGTSDTKTQDVVTALFDRVSETDRRALGTGFGRNIGELFEVVHGKRPTGLTEDMLIRDGAGKEIHQLLTDIMAWA